jgi:Leucine-rich repeat (LRR) protein
MLRRILEYAIDSDQIYTTSPSDTCDESIQLECNIHSIFGNIEGYNYINPISDDKYIMKYKIRGSIMADHRFISRISEIPLDVEHLHCNDTSINDVNRYKNLKILRCRNTDIKNVNSCTELTKLICYNTDIEDVSKCKQLRVVNGIR